MKPTPKILCRAWVASVGNSMSTLLEQSPILTDEIPDNDAAHIVCERCYPPTCDHWVAFCGAVGDEPMDGQTADTPMDQWCPGCRRIVMASYPVTCPRCGWDGRI